MEKHRCDRHERGSRNRSEACVRMAIPVEQDVQKAVRSVIERRIDQAIGGPRARTPSGEASSVDREELCSTAPIAAVMITNVGAASTPPTWQLTHASIAQVGQVCVSVRFGWPRLLSGWLWCEWLSCEEPSCAAGHAPAWWAVHSWNTCPKLCAMRLSTIATTSSRAARAADGNASNVRAKDGRTRKGIAGDDVRAPVIANRCPRQARMPTFR